MGRMGRVYIGRAAEGSDGRSAHSFDFTMKRNSPALFLTIRESDVLRGGSLIRYSFVLYGVCILCLKMFA